MGQTISSLNVCSNECKPLKMPNTCFVFLGSTIPRVISKFLEKFKCLFCWVTISLWFHFTLFLKEFVLHIFGLRCLRAQSKACACLSLLIQTAKSIIWNTLQAMTPILQLVTAVFFSLDPSFIQMSVCSRGYKKKKLHKDITNNICLFFLRIEQVIWIDTPHK